MSNFGPRKLTIWVDYFGVECIIYIKYFKNVTNQMLVDALRLELFQNWEHNEAILIKDVDFLFNRQYCIIVVIYE